MNLATPAVKRPATLAACCLLLGFFSIISSGCDAKKPSATSGPTPREAELTKTVEELRGKLAAAEHAAEEAKARAAALEQLKTAPAAPAIAGASADPASAADPRPADTSYVVVKKTFNAGQLIPVTSSNPNATERRPAQYWITFKGIPSGKEYPALEVKESAYGQFREGGDYSPQDINQAKVASAPANGAATAPSP